MNGLEMLVTCALITLGTTAGQIQTLSENCTACARDFYCPSQSARIPCPGKTSTNGVITATSVYSCTAIPGYYGNGSATLCEKDFYCPGGTEHIPCPFNTQTKGATGSRSQSDCIITVQTVPCTQGTYTVSGLCFACPQGTFSPAAGQPRCTNCPANTYADALGSSACKPCGSCPAGKLLLGCEGYTPGVCATCT